MSSVAISPVLNHILNQNRRDSAYVDGDILVSNLFTDSQVAALYVCMEATGIDKLIWHNDPPTLGWLLNNIRFADNQLTLMGFVQNKDGLLEVAGICWLSPPIDIGNGYKKADLSFGFLPHISIWNKLKIGRLMLDWIADKSDVDFIFGFTPIQNKHAIAYSKRIGFRVSSPVPNYCTWDGKPTSVIISTLEVNHGRKK